MAVPRQLHSLCLFSQGKGGHISVFCDTASLCQTSSLAEPPICRADPLSIEHPSFKLQSVCCPLWHTGMAAQPSVCIWAVIRRPEIVPSSACLKQQRCFKSSSSLFCLQLSSPQRAIMTARSTLHTSSR